MENNARLLEESVRDMAIKFPTIVTLHIFKRSLNLCLNISVVIFEKEKDIGFVAKRKSP